MRRSSKGLLAAFILGVIYAGTILLRGKASSVDDALISSCLADFLCTLSNISVVPYYFFPLMLFQVLYSSYISAYFSDSGIYYFSRIDNRSIWFTKKCAELLLLSFLYPAIFTLTKAALYLAWGLSSDNICGWWYVFGYYIAIYGLFLFTATLLVNIITIARSGGESIIGVVLLELTCTASYCLIGEYLPDPDYVTGGYRYFFEINPFGNLAFDVHSSRLSEVQLFLGEPFMQYDLSWSVLYFGVASVIVFAAGINIVARKRFLKNRVDV